MLLLPTMIQKGLLADSTMTVYQQESEFCITKINENYRDSLNTINAINTSKSISEIWQESRSQKREREPSEQLSHLAQVKLIVLQSLAITRLMPIPRGEINPQLHTTNSCSLSQFSQHISTPIPPRTRSHRVISVLRGPQAEPIMVLCSQNDSRKTRIFRHTDPLSRIQLSRVEHRWVGVPRPPLRVRESVGAEMQEKGHFC